MLVRPSGNVVVEEEECGSRARVCEKSSQAGRSTSLEELSAPLDGGEESECCSHICGVVEGAMGCRGGRRKVFSVR